MLSEAEKRERQRASKKRWIEANKERVREYNRTYWQAYYKKHRKHLIEAAKRYYQDHREEHKARVRAWQAAHPDYQRNYIAAKRAKEQSG